MGKWFQDKSFSTEKQEQGIKARKMHRDIKARKMHRAFGVLLAAALVFQTVPFEGIAVSASESSEGGLCEHHTEHTPDCGYKEAEPGQACTHEHTKDCYQTVEEEDGSTTKELDCHHEHDESCGYREAAEGSPCTFVCEICRGGTDEVPEDKTDDNGINDGDSENPGIENGDETKEPDDGQEECTCEERCTEDSINTDCPVCGAEDASLSDCKGKDTEDSTEDAEENTDQPEDTGLCKHHREHDDACGYLPESEDSEGSSCTYECRVCPIEKLIAALPDKVTEDNADEVRARLEEILALYRELTEDEQEQIDLSRCYELQKALDKTNAPMLAEVSVAYREADWNGSEVVYTDKSADCTPVENSTEAIEWTEGWYVVSNTVTIDEPITVSGAVNLILADGCNLTAEKGIVVTTGNSLTIYAQSENGGTLTATGTVDGNNASAGIGGSTASLDSGTITIHGGVINATGGGISRGNSGAGIGGGGRSSGNGGNSGTITIFGGVITSSSDAMDYITEGTYLGGAGIGGGGSSSDNGGTANSITIYGGDVTATSKGTQGGGAGIGGGAGAYNGGSGNITICGGTVRATGGCIDTGLGGAGIGGGGGGMSQQSGNGTVTISDGTVTAVGGNYAAGIGGGSGYQGSYGANITGGTGNVSITGGIVDAKGGAGNDEGDYAGAPIGNGGNASGGSVEKTTGIVFENGVGTVCGNVTFDGSYAVPADYSLHIPVGASLSGSGTLSGGGRFTTDLSEDMISVPEDWHYTGEDLTDQIKAAVSLNGEVTICGQTFTADTDGWELSVEKVSELEYTVKYIHTDGRTISKTVTIAKGQPSLSDAAAYKADGTTPATTFGVGETIIIKATLAFPTNGAVMAAAFTEPAGEQMAVYYDNTQISAPSTVENGVHTMTVDTNNLPPEALNKVIALTVKYIESNNTSGADTEVKVTVTAVAKVVNGSSTTYVGDLADAFTEGNSGATVTLLSEVDLGANYISIDNTFTLDLNGQTVKASSYGAFYISGGSITIQDSGTGGKIESSNATIEVNSGTLSVKSGTVSGFYGVRIISGTVNISGGAISGNDAGLFVDAGGNIALSGGTYNGKRTAIMVDGDASVSLKDMLATGYAYHQNDIPIAKAEGLVGDHEAGEVSLDAKPAWLTGTVTVKGCQHNGEGVCTYTHTSGTTTHQKTCLACGNKWDEENCNFGENGKCVCGAVLAVALKDNTELAYTGEAQTPEVNVTVDGIALAAEKYQLSYDNNINAGNTAKVTVTAVGGSFSGSVSTTFTIEKAALTIKANDQAITYGGSITEGTDQVTAAGLCIGDILSGITLTASTGEVPGGDITPYAAQIKNGSNEDVTANYDIVYETGKLTVSYMEPPAALLYNDDTAKGWYSGDVVITAAGYTVSDTLGGEYKDSYTISAQEGTVTKTLYFKDAAGHMSGGVEVMVKFDLTPPTGEIAVGAKWWENVLHFISFGNYAAKEYTVTIKAEDKKGSGISKIAYAIVTGSSQYTDADTLKAANLNWTEYNSGSRPTVPVSNSQYVVYARLTDNVGNVTYISTDGILLDNTPPTVGSLSVPVDTRKDVTAGFTFTVSEAADYYYVVLPKDSAAPDPEDIIVTCGGTLPEGTGTAISGTFPKGCGAVSADTLPAGVSVEAENLSPNTAYTVYVTAVDRAVDITDSAQGTPAGNIAVVQNVGFTTKKTLPVITKAPAVAGTYGQSVGEMTVTGGTAQAGSTVLAGTWTVSDADKNEKPSAGTSEVTVIFKPDNANYDSVSVQASLTVSQRNLNAEGVTVSEVAGTYTYTGSEIRPPVAVGTGTPAAGIYISDSGAALTTNDFTVSYSNHKDAGTASVTITGKGNYTGSVTRTFTIGKAPGREVPDVSGSYTDNGQTYTYTVTPTEGAVYRMGNDGKWQEGNVFEGITPGTSVAFYAKMPETGNYEDGTPKSITVDFPKLTPAAPALSYKADRTNPADVKVTITPVSGAEYSFDGGKTWTESNEQGGFTTSQTVVLAIRLKETDTHNQSPVQTVTVNLAKKDREAPPAFSLKVEANGETDYTVTIPATEGCEYSFDGEHWSDVNVKTGVSVGETVTGYKRYKETNDYNASSAVSAKETMPKFTVKTPVISPAGGSYTGNVSVTITCASPDAEIYYTTDGSAPGRGSNRYIGAFTLTAPATVKAIAVKDGLTDSAVVTASYTKKSSGGSGSGGNGGTGGNSGGNEDNGTAGENGGTEPGNGENGGQDSGSTSPGNGSTTPQIPVNPSAGTGIAPGNGAAPGTGTTPANPGNGNAARPGTSRNSGAGMPAGTKQPFIKDEDGKIGWDVIRAEEEEAREGSVINVDMNGSVVVPGDIFDSIRGKDITITFDMGNGILWSVDGESITTDSAGDIDFSVKKGVNTVPVDIVNNVTGEGCSIQISLAYEGEFGFTAVLSIDLGRENVGLTASLYYYNESTGELEFICADEVSADGTVSLAFTHASDYVIVVDGGEDGSLEETGTAGREDGNAPGAPEGADGGKAAGLEDAGEGKEPGTLLPAIAAIIIILIAGMAGALAVKRKKGREGERGAGRYTGRKRK